jgi:polyisoprenoid-binding protein YceI
MQKVFLLTALGLLTSLPTTLSYAADTYELDPTHTYVSWRINHLGFSTQTGKWYATGSLVLDKDHPENSKVNASIKIGDMVTGLPDLDEHLKGKDFFDVAQFPTATFVSNKVEMLGTGKAKVYGTLTLHGIKKPSILMVTLNKAGENPISHKTEAGFSATTSLKRSDFGMKTYLPMLGDDIDLTIEAEALKPTAKA